MAAISEISHLSPQQIGIGLQEDTTNGALGNQACPHKSAARMIPA